MSLDKHSRNISEPTEYEEIMNRKKSAFPKDFDHCGWLDVRTRASKPWKRRYFVLANNFLLMGATQFAQKLEKVIPLEGSNIKTTTKTSNMSFEILHRKNRHQFRAPNEEECNVWTEKIQRASRLKIRDVYLFQEILGSNVDGSTKVIAAKHIIRGEEVAIKMINKKEYDNRMLSNEVLILKRLDHPNVVRLYDLFETTSNVYLVMEKCHGGELFEQITALNGGGFSEKESIHVLHQIASAVKYMHSMGIVHRDLKPENILCVEANSIKLIKIADFGISKVIFDPETKRKKKKRKSKKREINENDNEENNENKDDEGNDDNTTENNKNQDNNDEENEIDDNNENKKNSKILKKHKNQLDFSNDDDNENNDEKENNNDKQKNKKKKEFVDPLKRKKNLNSHKNQKQNDDLQYTMTTMCGTISYTAPEILKERPYDKRVDYWSLGVIMFILLCGYPPFLGETEYEVAQSILNDKVELDEEDWDHVSDQGKKLVMGLLQKEPRKRLGCEDILSHTWIFTAKENVSQKARASLLKTVAKRRIRKMSMGVFEQNLNRLNKIYKSRDDSDSHTRRSSSIFNSNGRFSKTEDELFELRIPSIGSPKTLESNL